MYDNNTLGRVLGIGKGDVYDLELVNKRLNYNPTGADVSSLYLDNGYLFFTIDPVEVRIEDDSIDVEMRIHEGTQATINKVIVKGNDRTNDHVILREIRTLPGQKFSREQLIRTNREIAQLGYFDPEQIGMQPIPQSGRRHGGHRIYRGGEAQRSDRAFRGLGRIFRFCGYAWTGIQ